MHIFLNKITSRFFKYVILQFIYPQLFKKSFILLQFRDFISLNIQRTRFFLMQTITYTLSQLHWKYKTSLLFEEQKESCWDQWGRSRSVVTSDLKESAGRQVAPRGEGKNSSQSKTTTQEQPRESPRPWEMKMAFPLTPSPAWRHPQHSLKCDLGFWRTWLNLSFNLSANEWLEPAVQQKWRQLSTVCGVSAMTVSSKLGPRRQVKDFAFWSSSCAP